MPKILQRWARARGDDGMRHPLWAQFQIRKRDKGTEVYLGMQTKQFLSPLHNFSKVENFQVFVQS